MKKHFNSGVLALGFVTILAAFNVAAENGGVMEAYNNISPGSLTANQGDVVCTAAVNSDGSLASKKDGSFVLSSSQPEGIGTYQVLFKAPCNNVTAAQGFARFVQVDTLTIGSTRGYCTTANRYGLANGVWVHCFDGTGAAANRSFFLFVTR